jgi:hypothetical protein
MQVISKITFTRFYKKNQLFSEKPRTNNFLTMIEIYYDNAC